MYEFIDTTEALEGTSLPSEALKINGIYIEDEIPGYRTLTVEGREALSPEIETFETGIRDGSSKQSRRYPARTIRITYQLRAETCEDFRAAYNKLAGILDVEDARLIFNDENDKFYIGTPSRIGEVPPGRNSVIGEFDILCLDPFKYSVVEYEAKPDAGSSSVIIDYNGTYKSFPKLQAEFYNENESSEDGETATALTGSGDCGYVAFFNENEKIIQIGDPDEADSESAYEKSQTLINQRFDSANGWGSAAQSQWSVNSAMNIVGGIEQVGSLKTAVASYTQVTAPKASGSTPILPSATSTADEPTIKYRILAKYLNRTKTGVTVMVSIMCSLGADASFFGKGYTLRAKFTMNGQTKDIVLKDSKTVWRGTVSHTTTISFNITLDAKAWSLPSTFEAYRNDGTGGKAGTLAATACAHYNIPAYPDPEPEAYYLCANSYGSGSAWHGASITRAIPADAKGDVGATNFQLSYSQKMCTGSGSGGYNERGAFQALLVNNSGGVKRIVAGVFVFKSSNGSSKANLRFSVNGVTKETIQIPINHGGSIFTAAKQSVITKTGQTVTFNICGVTKTYKDAALANVAVTEVSFSFGKYGQAAALAYNGLYWAKFVKNNCDVWRDIPNKFSANDVVEADCNSGKIYLNGNEAQAYGALGNDWEDFCLTPGSNQIGFAFSEWVEAAYAPAFKVKYREVFL